MSTGIAAIWTDFGGVLTPPVSDDTASFCAARGVPVDAWNSALRAVGDRFGTDVMAPLDTPLISEDQWAALVETELEAQHGVRVDLRCFGEQWFAGRAGNPRWEYWLRGLHDSGVFVGLLSNMPPSWDAHWRALVPPEGLFDDVVLSYAVGSRKPSPEIFALAAARAGMEPGECVLVDDLEKNCQGARDAGWQAVCFRSADQAIEWIAPRLAVGEETGEGAGRR